MDLSATTKRLGALTLFVEETSPVTTFYREVLGLRTVFENDVSTVFDLGGTMPNVLAVTAAAEVVAPARPAVIGATPRMLLGLWVEDVDVVCRELQERDIVLLNGPVDRSWDKRTAACTDPAGAVWKIAQDMRERTAQRSGHRRKRAAARSVPSKARWNSRRRHCTRACAKAERGFPATANGSGTTAFTAAAARACRAAVGDEGDGRAA